jgi:hypothetical protein
MSRGMWMKEWENVSCNDERTLYLGQNIAINPPNTNKYGVLTNPIWPESVMIPINSRQTGVAMLFYSGSILFINPTYSILPIATRVTTVLSSSHQVLVTLRSIPVSHRISPNLRLDIFQIRASRSPMIFLPFPQDNNVVVSLGLCFLFNFVLLIIYCQVIHV